MSSMQFKKYQYRKGDLFFIIEEELVGWYLIVYEQDANISCEDYLLDTLEDALFEAKNRFEISQNQWQEVVLDKEECP